MAAGRSCWRVAKVNELWKWQRRKWRVGGGGDTTEGRDRRKSHSQQWEEHFIMTVDRRSSCQYWNRANSRRQKQLRSDRWCLIDNASSQNQTPHSAIGPSSTPLVGRWDSSIWRCFFSIARDGATGLLASFTIGPKSASFINIPNIFLFFFPWRRRVFAD